MDYMSCLKVVSIQKVVNCVNCVTTQTTICMTSLIGGSYLRIMGSVVLHWEFANETFCCC